MSVISEFILEDIEEIWGGVSRAPGGHPRDFNWVQDAPLILAAIDRIFARIKEATKELTPWTGIDWTTMKPEVIVNRIQQELRAADDLYGWGAPRMAEGHEDRLLDVTVAWRVAQLIQIEGREL